MSLSINTPAFVNVDNAHLDQSVPMPASSNLPSVANKPVQEILNTLKDDAVVDSGTLNKLFDMLDLVFKALREMFAGKQSKASVLPDKADLPTKPETGKQLSEFSSPAPIKPDTAPDAKAGDVPGLMREALKQQSEAKPDTAVNHEVNTNDLPVTTRSALRPNLGSVLASDSKSGITVSNDSKADVHLNVNIDHCHCPDMSLDTGRRPRSVPTVQVLSSGPDVDFTAETTPHTEHAVTPKPGQEVKPGLTPELTPHTEHAVTPKPGQEEKPGLTPELMPHTEHADTPKPGQDVKPGLAPELTPHTDHAETPKPGQEMKPGLTPEQAPHAEHEVISKADFDEGDNKVKRNPKDDLTSPGPAANQFEFQD